MSLQKHSTLNNHLEIYIRSIQYENSMKVFNKRILHVYLHYGNSYNNNEKYMRTTIGDFKTN